MKAAWMLAIALKSLVQAVKTRNADDLAPLFDRLFVQSVSYLAMQGTGFSQHWLVTDLEVSVCYLRLSS